MGRWQAVVAGAASGLVGCGSGADTGDPSRDGDDGAAGAAIDDEGFEAAPEVAFPGQAATGFGGGDRLCREQRSEISPELANVLGFDVEGDRAVLEATQVLDVLASWSEVRRTAVHYRGHIARILRVDRRPPAGGYPVEQAVPVGCPSGVEYELVEQVYTEDGAVRGAFTTQVPATQLGEPTARRLGATADLRNFTGQLPVGRVDAQDAFASVSMGWPVGAVESPEFALSVNLWGGPSYHDCGYAYCRDDSDLGLPLSYGVASGTALSESFDDLLSSLPIYTPSTLTELSASIKPYTPNVRVWVTANEAAGVDRSSASRAHVAVRADGQSINAGALDLVANTDRLPGGVVGGFIDLGRFPEGTRIDLDVQDDLGLGNIRSHILVNQCDIGEATAFCTEPGCTTTSSLTIVAAECAGAAQFEAH